MPPRSSSSPEWRRIDRAGWLLWTATFALLLALTATVPALYYPLLELGRRSGDARPLLRDEWVAIVGLAGLVVLFCLYTITKQREIHVMRQALETEERERDTARTRLSEMLALFEVSTTLQLQLRLDVILEILVRRVVSTFKAQQASVMIMDPESGELVTRASYGLEAEFSRGARARVGEGIAGWVALRRQPILLGLQAPSAEFARFYKENRTISSALSMPLVIGDRIVGVLNVNRINHPDPFRDEHLDLLRVFGEHFAAIIDRAEVVERLGLRARQLEQDNEKLSDLNQMKDVFLSTASHELKTPLSSVIAYAELLDDHEGKLTRDQSHEFVGRLRGEAHRLLGLIDDILDLSRLESGKMQLKQRLVSLAEVVRGAVETTRTTAKKYDVTIESDLSEDLPPILVDEVKMRQVAVNLLVNAIKFSPRGSAVRLRTRLDDRHVRIEVSDDGPGIAPESATHIFELFAQGTHPEQDSRGGLGIGLHLVKRLTELHGGHVGVNSRDGAGSTFWVRLPIHPAIESTPGSEQDSRKAA
ncbi:MAG: HAMP domain-containing histidine kinase [Candidatus Eisenbacteria bacterium]|nr:HAMP domain-containing histidine kinase [Candidatus Eisenbacteria bacterium]